MVRREGGQRGPVHVSAADPMNLVGIVTPGSRVNPLSGGVVELLPATNTAAAVS